MKRIEIVTHAYAEEYPHFAKLLAFQCSSLILYPPECDVQLTVCHAKSDSAVGKVLRFFRRRKVNINSIEMAVGEVGRRSIGRNIAAKASKADIVWFADADYFFGPACLDRLSTVSWSDDVCIRYPKRVLISKDFVTGDATIARMPNRLGIVDVRNDAFITTRYWKAIGGAQIVKGDLAREFGYLDQHPKWQQTTNRPFHDTVEDSTYRMFCLSKGYMDTLILPELYRIRHTTSALNDHDVS